MVNTINDYDNSYSYRSQKRRKQCKQIIWQRIMGSILLLLSFFVLFMLPDQEGNWTLAALLIIVSAALFIQIGGLRHD
jgi:succinate dehydrogenase hydrophobic anchor subunit